jgi:methionine-rich copper-binding protein CopC
MRKISFALLILILGGLLFVETAYAHAAYLRSNPGENAIIAAPPARVDIWFEQELFRRKGENTITVTSPDGKVVSSSDTPIDDDDRTHIWVDLQSGLPNGNYLVEWRNVSLEDGHPSEGSFNFIIDPLAKVTSTPMESVTMADSPPPQATQPNVTPQPPPIADSAPTNILFTSGFALTGVLLIAFYFMRRVRRK